MRGFPLFTACLFLVLAPLFPSAIVSAQVPDSGRLIGKIMIKGDGPMADGTVLLFDAEGPPPSMTDYFRVPDMTLGINGDGGFAAELREGSYYLGGIRKPAGAPAGPPRDGDLFFLSRDEKNVPRVYKVRKGETTDTGVISEAEPFKTDLREKEGITAVKGTVTDAKGRPVEGCLVLAFPAGSAPVERPLFVSNWTGKDGRYVLGLHGGGDYYLRAVSDGGSQGYDNKGKINIKVRSGEVLKGVDIKDVGFPVRTKKGG